MSASEVTYDVGRTYYRPRLHLVSETEVPTGARGRTGVRTVPGIPARVRMKTYAALGSVAAVFTAGFATVVWAFLSIPNTPLP